MASEHDGRDNPDTDIAAPNTPAKTWTGGLATCDCGATNAEYLKDRDHDGGTCEVFRCRNCGGSFHVELPD